MSKRGGRRPFVVRYRWGHEPHVSGTDTFETLERAEDFADTLRRNAQLRDSTVEVLVMERFTNEF